MLQPMHSPAHPGALIRENIEGIREETGRDLTIGQVAKALDVSRQTLTKILSERGSVTPEMAFRLGKAFGPNPEFWIKVQETYDMAQARKNINMDQVQVLWSRDTDGQSGQLRN